MAAPITALATPNVAAATAALPQREPAVRTSSQSRGRHIRAGERALQFCCSREVTSWRRAIARSSGNTSEPTRVQTSRPRSKYG